MISIMAARGVTGMIVMLAAQRESID